MREYMLNVIMVLIAFIINQLSYVIELLSQGNPDYKIVIVSGHIGYWITSILCVLFPFFLIKKK